VTRLFCDSRWTLALMLLLLVVMGGILVAAAREADHRFDSCRGRRVVGNVGLFDVRLCIEELRR